MSSDTPAQSTDLTSAMERVGKITAVIASFSLIVSVFYDWGFISALGLRFSEVPTSVSDHVRSWLVWLPNVVIGVFGVLALELMTRRIEKGMTEEEIIQSSSNPSRTEKMRRRPFHAIGLLGVAVVVLWLLFGDLFRVSLNLGLIVCWFLFTGWVFSHPTLRARHAESFRLFVHWAPPIMIWFYFSGFNDATAQINSTRPTDVVQIKSSQPVPSELQARILRSFERWLLVQDINKQVVWVRADDVLRIEGHSERAPFRGIACWFSDSLCYTPSTPTGKQR